MKRQDQVEDSRERIERGLLVSAVRTGYGRLSNTQIARAAGVSRMTFYRHFNNKRDVLISLLERLSGDIHRKSDNDASGVSVDLKALLHRRFEVLQKNRTLQLLLTDLEAREVFRAFRWRRSHEVFPESNDGRGLYRRAFVFAGLDAMVLRWFETGLQESVDEMVELALPIVVAIQRV